jgi:hypothetical protein
LARNSSDEVLYAIKVFNNLADMQTEILNMTQLDNENVVKIYHSCPGEEIRLKNETVFRPYIVLEFA